MVPQSRRGVPRLTRRRGRPFYTKPAGRKIAFVSDIRAYKTLKRDGWEIWSAQEVANIIDKFYSKIDWGASEAMRQTKKLFPDAEIKRVRPKATLDDAIPF